MPNEADDGKPAGLRQTRAADRRRAILEAALACFSEQGFTATRMEDVARRAGVAKGTIYLHFTDKQALFAGLIRSVMVTAVSEALSAEPRDQDTGRDVLTRIVLAIADSFRRPPRRDVIRLLIAEGPRFPEITELYFREVVQPGLVRLTALAEEAAASGELRQGRPFMPQLVIAPILMGVIWEGLFGRLQPLDADALIEAQLDLLFRPAKEC